MAWLGSFTRGLGGYTLLALCLGTRVMLRAAIVVVAATLFATQAHAARVCAWMIESNGGDDGDMRNLEIWLESDSDLDFLYSIGGKGIVSEGSTANSPSSGTFVLHPKTPEKPWGFGTTLYPPGEIDVTITLHQTPADIFSDAPTPVLASFAFARRLPQSEKSPPPILAKHQCSAVIQSPIR